MVLAIWIILQFSETWGGGQWPDLALAGGGAQYECGEEETIRRKKEKVQNAFHLVVKCLKNAFFMSFSWLSK